MTDLSHKKNVRGGDRASATKMVRKAEELFAQEDPNHSQLARIRLSLQEKLSILKELDSEVVDLVKEEEVAHEIEQVDVYMEDIYDAIAKLEQLSLKNTTVPYAGPPPSRDPASESKVRLPKLTIQPFRGELITWTTFWDSFEAVQVLTSRFGNKQLIIDRYMELLLSVETVVSDSNLRALRHLYDTVEAQVRGLNSMGVKPETYGALLSSVVLGKLPQEIRLLLSRGMGGGDKKLDDLMKLLLDELQARERATASTLASGKGRGKMITTNPTAAALFAGDQRSTPRCYYCQQSHLSHACTKVVSIDERKRILRSVGRCFLCLHRGHILRQCNSKRKCPRCSGRHHESNCGGQQPSSPSSNEPKPKREFEQPLKISMNLSTRMQFLFRRQLRLSLNCLHPLFPSRLQCPFGLVAIKPSYCRQPEPLSTTRPPQRNIDTYELFLTLEASAPM